MSKRVAILGGGVAGMTAAQELAERRFQVVVYEARGIPGGKARSIPVPGTGTGGRKDLPGEHGFRFFPGFYRHLPDTMRRIPFGKGWVSDNLVSPSFTQIARAGNSEVFAPAQLRSNPLDLAATFRFLFANELDLPPRDLRHYAEKLLVLLTSCHERRLAQYEKVDWWTFVDADHRSPEFRKYCADGITRSCVACRAQEMSTRTGGYILLQLMLDFARPGVQVNRVLNGPTNEVWIDPWLKHLQALGVDYRTDAPVQEIHFAAGRITGVTVFEKGAEQRVEADYYVAALPVEVAQRLFTDAMKEADPSLARLHELRTAWMNGIQFYLDRDVSVVRGHTLYADSQWSLTSISQKQFWTGVDLAQYGDGSVDGILSVDISDWETKGLNGKTAMECTAEEVKEEVWNELKAHLNDDEVHEIKDANLVRWFLDPAIVYPNPTQVTNLEPLLINTVGSWDCRPEAVTRIPNLFLAADYVRTHTDLATMEAANEAARRAVNGILRASGSRDRPCRIWPLREPFVFAPLRFYDRLRFRRGLPHDPRLIRVALYSVVPLWKVLRLAHRGMWRLLYLGRWMGRSVLNLGRRQRGPVSVADKKSGPHDPPVGRPHHGAPAPHTLVD